MVWLKTPVHTLPQDFQNLGHLEGTEPQKEFAALYSSIVYNAVNKCGVAIHRLSCEYPYAI